MTLSSYMLIGAMVAIAAIAQPAVTTYIVLAGLGPYLIITREVARLEGRPRWSRIWLVVAAITLAAVIFAAVSIRWFAI